MEMVVHYQPETIHHQLTTKTLFLCASVVYSLESTLDLRMLNRYNKDNVNVLLALHTSIRDEVEERLVSFRKLWESATEEELFCELAFCLLTPQSSAGRCWEKVEEISCSGMLMEGSADELGEALNPIRFRYNKGKYLAGARELFTRNGTMDVRGVLSAFTSASKKRDFLVDSVKGLGYKEASHFLRNVGHGDELAILDRHILRGMAWLGIINDEPKALTPRRYLEHEQMLAAFAGKTGIPLDHLDFVLWYRARGFIFK